VAKVISSPVQAEPEPGNLESSRSLNGRAHGTYGPPASITKTFEATQGVRNLLLRQVSSSKSSTSHSQRSSALSVPGVISVSMMRPGGK
jgi:hypothetical protein